MREKFEILAVIFFMVLTTACMAYATTLKPGEVYIVGNAYGNQIADTNSINTINTSNNTNSIGLMNAMQSLSSLDMRSDAGDYIGQGKTYSYSFSDMRVSVNTLDMNKNGLVDRISFFIVSKTTAGDSWSVNFSTDKLGKDLSVGFYENAERSAFASAGHPGLDVSGQGRGSNKLTGKFNIIDVKFDYSVPAAPKLISFAASFEQHSEGKAPALTGVIYYNYHADPYKYVKVQGRQLMVDFNKTGIYVPYTIKGVGYEPMPIGRHVSDWGYADANDPRPANVFDDPAILNRDFKLLEGMKANTIRIWKGDDTQEGLRFPVKLTTKTLDYARMYNLKVIAGFWIDVVGEATCNNNFPGYITKIDLKNNEVRKKIVDQFVAYVTAFKNRPEILFWAIGNENNFKLNTKDPKQIAAWYSLVNEMARQARLIEGEQYYHPVAVVNGDLGYIGDMAKGASDRQMPYVDIWGVNVYRGKTFGNLFTVYKGKSAKPLWISEYGVDAWSVTDTRNPDKGFEDGYTQALWDGLLWDDIVANGSVTIGGTLMAYSDEWWKPYEWLCGSNSESCNREQNHFGVGPHLEGCPVNVKVVPAMPDYFDNGEWWGIMKISPSAGKYQPDVMTPRPVYYTLQKKFEAQKYPCNGSYSGSIDIQDASVTAVLRNVASLKDVVYVYFDTDPGIQGADYNLTFYPNRTWSLRKASQPGYFSIGIASGNLIMGADKSVTAKFKSALIKEKILASWNYAMRP